MGKKIFVSYKYSDPNVLALNSLRVNTTARHYVDEIEKILEDDDNIYKGEDDGEDIGSLADTTIGSKLGDKIFDSSITIVLISKGMKDHIFDEKDQWISWEISYSLREQSRGEDRSKTNAMLAIVLPDVFGSYEYFIIDVTCPHCKSRTLNTNILFQILRDNMFNIKKPTFVNCANHTGAIAYSGRSSYIHSVKWSDFISEPNTYLNISVEINKNISDYEITKTIR